jgi:hypothetical protein
VSRVTHYLATSAIAELFCRDSTFSLSDVDRRKIISLALPQKFQTERRYEGAFLKQLFLLHALRQGCVRSGKVLWAWSERRFSG